MRSPSRRNSVHEWIAMGRAGTLAFPIAFCTDRISILEIELRVQPCCKLGAANCRSSSANERTYAEERFYDPCVKVWSTRRCALFFRADSDRPDLIHTADCTAGRAATDR